MDNGLVELSAVGRAGWVLWASAVAGGFEGLAVMGDRLVNCPRRASRPPQRVQFAAG